jgi:hypothetical protein
MNIEIIIQEYRGEINEIVFITNEDGSTLSMLKSTYDEMIAKQEENK